MSLIFVILSVFVFVIGNLFILFIHYFIFNDIKYIKSALRNYLILKNIVLIRLKDLSFLIHYYIIMKNEKFINLQCIMVKVQEVIL